MTDRHDLRHPNGNGQFASAFHRISATQVSEAADARATFVTDRIEAAPAPSTAFAALLEQATGGTDHADLGPGE